MQIQEIIILGLLKESSRHGYEIKKIAKERLGIFSSLENKSFYYPLKIMEEKGFITKKKSQSREGPSRYIYSITEEGKKEFSSLALKTLMSQKRPFIDIDIPLYFLPYLEKKEVLSRLRLRKRFLEKVKEWLADNLELPKKFPIHQRMLLRHHQNLLNAEEGFIENIIEIIKNY
ncbi:MAG: PadR family transcriptional regulator [Candidatus Omnitrophica bacterium]|nr:PadR family transcriptional regulator [Candidatus Omnitrophota bacterium]MCF7877976.1 PadR family transcriptional regulator [Candidatus Omnitrophota bacterium]MCF7892723.1 PadR family transcriptional regulator [Candidatus Omnitrophota bacterium]